MKLYEIEPRSLFRIVDDSIKIPMEAPDMVKEEIYKLHNIDGMYSYCTDNKGKVCHLAAWTEVEIV